ncbi:MAG: hypothetical protein SFW66_02280 [Gammaproteobacteria bacterium]|nr:hypothetical protein [Gammaproteobacteria bacterium]
MKKEFVFSLLQEYDAKKGIFRKLFSDSASIKKLRSYSRRQLSHLQDDNLIQGAALRELYDLVCERKNQLRDKEYYFNRDSLTNHVFHKIIFAFAEDQFAAKLVVQKRILLAEEKYDIDKPSRSTYEQIKNGVISIAQWFVPGLFKADNEKKVLQKTLREKIEIPITLDPAEFPHVITDFSYQTALGQKNEDHLSIEALEDLNPRGLALTATGELIYAEDVVRMYNETGTFRNPQSVEVHARLLAQDTLNRMIRTKPLFRTALTNAVDGRISDRHHKVTQSMINAIREAGNIMESDNSFNYTKSYKALADLRAYIDLLPTASRDFILNFRVNGRQTMNGLLNVHDVCRHIVGERLSNASNALQVYVSENDEPAFFDALHDAQIYQADMINGLRIR